MATLDFIKNISINSAILNQNNENLNDDRIVTLQTSFEQTVQRGENPLRALQGLRMRVLVATNKRCAQINDFVSQRFNEYINLGDAGLLMPEDRFIRTMDTDLRQKLEVDFFQITTPLGPYSAWDTVVDRTFSPEAPQMDIGSRQIDTPLNTIIYDIELDSLLPRDPQTQELVRPRLQRASSTDLEEVVLAPIQISLNSFLPTLSVPNQENLEQLTFYVFMYFPSIPLGPGLEAPPNDEMQSLNTGMSKIGVANVSGVRTIFESISSENYPMLGDAFAMGFMDTRDPLAPPYEMFQDFSTYQFAPTTRAKEADIFQTFNIGLEQEINNEFVKLYDMFYNDIFAADLFGGKGAKNVIKDDNYFSDFYLSEDLSSNVRYTFAFDIRSYLAKNSYFPYLYLNRHSSDQLIQGTGLMDMADRSRILSVSMRRQRVEKLSQNLGNDLGTDSKTKVIGPNSTFPIFVLDSPRAVKVFQSGLSGPATVPEMSTKKLTFYEGEDIFERTTFIRGPKGELVEIAYDKRQMNGEFQYGAIVHVFDQAPEYVRRLVNLMRKYRHNLNHIYDIITLSVPTEEGYQGGIVTNDRNLYNYATGRINVNLRDIETLIDGRRQFVMDVINNILFNIDMEIQSLVSASQMGIAQGGIVAYFTNQLNVAHADPRTILDLDKLIGLLIGFFMGKLTEIFPKDPYGNLKNYQPNTFSSPGYGFSEMPLKICEHWFSQTFSRGQNYHYGNDFIFHGKDMEKTTGLNSISLTDYQERVSGEFEKYFQSIEQGALDYQQIPEPYLSPAVKYLTPRLIQTPEPPERPDVYQEDFFFGGGNRVVYDINRYAIMFADIGKLNIQNKYIDRVFNTVDDSEPNASPNKNLFNSVLHNLSNYYATDFEVGETKVYEPPSVQVGSVPVSTPRRDYTVIPSTDFSTRYQTPPVIPTVVGGPTTVEDETSTETFYRESVDTTIKNNDTSDKPDAAEQKRINTIKGQVAIPIKLPFAIFGELFVDPSAIFDVEYQNKPFNSLTRLASVLGISSQNVVRSIEDFFGGLPNQTKSALVLAAANNVKDFGSNPGGSSFDAVRPVLEDKDTGEREALISYYEPRQGLENDVYPLTRDPAKVYAKFLTFWMNYKNIAVIEYLSGYGNLNTNPGLVNDIYNGFQRDGIRDLNLEHKTKFPLWQPLTAGILNELETINQDNDEPSRLLCRVRLKSPEDIKGVLDPKSGNALEGETVVEEFFAQKPMITLPTYNKHFFIQPGEVEKKKNPPKEPPPATVNPTVGFIHSGATRRY